MVDTIHIADRGAFRWRTILLWGLRGVFVVLVGLATLSVLRNQAAGAPFHDRIVIFVLLAFGAIVTEAVLRNSVRTSQILAWVNLRLRAAETLVDDATNAAAQDNLRLLSPVAAIGNVTTILGAGFITLVLLIGMATMSRLALFIQVVFLVISGVAMLLSRYAGDPFRPWWEVGATAALLLGTFVQIHALPGLAIGVSGTNLALIALLSLACVLPAHAIVSTYRDFPRLNWLPTAETTAKAGPNRHWAPQSDATLDVPGAVPFQMGAGQVVQITTPDTALRHDLVLTLGAYRADDLSYVAAVFDAPHPFVPPCTFEHVAPATLLRGSGFEVGDDPWPGGFAMDLSARQGAQLALLAALGSDAPVVAVECAGPLFDGPFTLDPGDVVQSAKLTGKTLVLVQADGGPAFEITADQTLIFQGMA